MKAISVKNVFKYFGSVKALEGVSLEVEEGTVYGLLGPNGAGKTTLVKVMTTLLAPDSGEVNIGEIDVVAHPERLRPIIGLAGQYASVDEFLTGRENLEMVARLYHLDRKTSTKQAQKVLEQLDLTKAANRPVKTYSGGMRRRLDLGASLVAEPKILFLDEPTTGLDPRTRFDMWDIIRNLAKNGTTILLTTQYLEEADELADKISVLDNGKVIIEGTANELKDYLGNDVIEFKLCDESQKSIAIEAVKSVAKEAPSYDEVNKVVKIPVVDGSKSLMSIVRVLDQSKVKLTELSLHRPSLDDVFMAVTSRTPKLKEPAKARRSEG